MFNNINNRLASLYRSKRWAYRSLLMSDGDLSPAAAIVLADLKKICHAQSKIQAESDAQTYINIGHHEIWQHINGYLNLSEDQIAVLTEDIKTYDEEERYVS